MKISVKFFGVLRQLVEINSIDVELEKSISMAELLNIISKKTKKDLTDKLLENNKIKKGTLLLINGKNVTHLQGLKTFVPTDSTVSFFPPSGGG